MAQGVPRRTFVPYWLPVLGYVSLIFVLSAQPGLQPPFHFQNADKVCHMTEYGGLGVLLARALNTLPRFRNLLAACLLAIAIGAAIAAADEVFQSTVPDRDPDVLDWVADTIGLSLAQVVYLWVRRP